METIRINNNISLHYIEMKKLKTTVTGTYIRRKLDKDEASKNAVLPYVLKNGSEKFPKVMDITKELQGLYGASLNAGVIKNGDNQIIFFDAETISDKYTPNNERLTAGLTDLLMNVIFRPLTENGAFSKSITEREKKTVKDKIDALINDKRTYAMMRCAEELCKDDVFAISKFGKSEDIDKIDEKNLYEHYKSIITSSQIDIFVCGEADIHEIKSKIEEYIKDLSFTDFTPFESAVIKQTDKKENVSEKLDVTQGKMSLGFTTGISAKDSEYPALVVANSIYGAGTHSKLFNNVREKLSLAYYASSTLNKYKGIMFVNAGIEFENFDKAYEESIFQLDELKNGKISEEEFTFSKNSIIDNLNTYYDDQRYMQLYVLDCLYLGIPYDLEAYNEKINSVTKEDIIAAAGKIKENVIYFLTGKDR